MIGRYLDALPQTARARLIQARRWSVGGYVDGKGARSLLGHAEDWWWDVSANTTHCRAPELLRLREAAGDTWLNWPPLIDLRYDHLVDRVGLDGAAELVRRRAAHGRGADSWPHD